MNLEWPCCSEAFGHPGTSEGCTPGSAGLPRRRLPADVFVAVNPVPGDGSLLHYTPHDFRRIFATEAVSGGLPVHIAAKLLGHANLNTTQGYVAVYQDDVVRRHAAFIARRRAQRPGQEYREPSPQEWAEFEQHFTRRKLELGTGRQRHRQRPRPRRWAVRRSRPSEQER